MSKGFTLATAGCFMSIVFCPHPKNDGGNSDSFVLTIDTGNSGGQQLKNEDGEYVNTISFTIIGGCEMAEFFSGIKSVEEEYKSILLESSQNHVNPHQ